MGALSTLSTYHQDGKLKQKFEIAPPWMNLEAEYGFALQHLRANPYLEQIADGNPTSLLSAFANVAACGLSLNPAKKEAYLVPRKGNICLDPSYMGLVKLATDTGAIEWVQAKLVYANDTFVMHGVDEKPTHEFSPFGDRGELVGVYCVARTSTGAYLTETMSIAEVYEIRDRSEAYKKNPQKTPWHSDPGEMIKKTVVKRASKMWPKSDDHIAESRLAAAIQVSHANEEVKLATSSPNLTDYSDEQKKVFDQYIEQDDALGMYEFQQTTPPGVFTSLYHSFERPKGKYQRVVDELTSRGHSQFVDYLEAYNVAKQEGDDLGLQEIQDEVSSSVWELLGRRGQ